MSWMWLLMIMLPYLVAVPVVIFLLFRQKELTRRVNAAEQRTGVFIESVAQGYVETTMEGRVTEWNPRAEMLFGWTRDEAIGRMVVDLIALPEEREAKAQSLASFIESQNSKQDGVSTEMMVRSRAQGEPFGVGISVWLTDVRGECRINALLNDISERKRLEAQREMVFEGQKRLVAELRAADKAKSDFVSTVSHELRTPLTSIVGYLELLQEGFGGELTSQQHSMVDVIDRNSRRLLSLIEDLLTLSHMEAGGLQLSFAPIDVAALVSGVQQALMPRAMQQELAFEAQVSADSGWIIGDYRELERVLLNLTSNAVKFTPAGGSVLLRAERDGPRLRLIVRDTGIGIPPEDQERLFERFFRSASANELAISGTGLGLTIVKNIAERHGGSVAVESEVGVGTTFTVTLPVSQDEYE